jgi:hypothetical protein
MLALLALAGCGFVRHWASTEADAALRHGVTVTIIDMEFP